MLDPLVKNQEQISKLEAMKRYGQYAQRVAISVPHILFGKNPMERLAQTEQKCNEDIEKYSQDVNKQIHDILINS